MLKNIFYVSTMNLSLNDTFYKDEPSDFCSSADSYHHQYDFFYVRKI